LPEVEVIPGQMRQVFQNLLSNALKFGKPGVNPIITVHGQRVRELSFSAPEDQEGAYCKVLFTDNGIGFEAEFIDTIFQLFQRLHSKDKYEGTGIGLAITKKIIEKHNGIITAASERGHGTVFSFVIPLRHG
jgi:two-component system, chemotaxis family, CheB/CheR fusion protein